MWVDPYFNHQVTNAQRGGQSLGSYFRNMSKSGGHFSRHVGFSLVPEYRKYFRSNRAAIKIRAVHGFENSRAGIAQAVQALMVN